MWHASVSSKVLGFPELRKAALRVLERVGSADLGQWEDTSHYDDRRSVHIRRRLSLREEARVGPVRDVRGTEEEIRRAQIIEGFNGIPWETLVEIH